MKIIKSFLLIGLFTLIAATAVSAQQSGEINGEVADAFGGAVVGATISISNGAGFEKTAETDGSGRFVVGGLIPGRYTVTVSAPSFTIYEITDIDVKTTGNKKLNIELEVEGVSEEVEISENGNVNTDAANNASALVLKEADLEALPDDPDDLEAALQALAGGGAGPNGGQINIDGFEGGNLPPKEAIREIRINRDPFSAEFDRMGFGRIEILTKPGALKWNGQAYFNFNDDLFNARNPFSVNKADSQTKFYGGYISGPVIKNKASFSLGINNRDISNGSSINATVIDPNFNIVPFQQEFSEPNKRFSINPRFDYQINDKNTLVTRYEFERRTSENVGGGFVLPSRGTQSENTEHTIQLTETAIINAKTINETRFQYRSENREVTGDNTIPAINVLDAFFGGGATTGLNYNREKFWEVQNYTTTSFGSRSEHSIKFGVKISGQSIDDRTETNYAGTYTFTGFTLNAPSIYDVDGNGLISSAEQYRAKLLGATDPLFNPNQFSISAGNPLADISQVELGAFFKDDWQVNPGFTLSYGIRYENQTNIDDKVNFAPRLAFAYSPGAGGASPPKTVFRGGAGIFYTRFGENFALQARRLDGVQQQQFIIGGNNAILGQPVFSLDGVTNSLTAAQLANVAPLTSTPRIIASDIQAPYTVQGAFSVERQLPGRTTVSIYYTFSRNYHMIRSRNINAPVCPPGTPCPVGNLTALQALRPDISQGNLYQYESSGYAADQRLIFRFSTLFSRNFTLFSNYFLGSSKGDSDGNFPAYSYDISDEFGTSARDVRHTFFMVGVFRVPHGIGIRPFIIARSGSPFNITAGQDLNGDSIFNDRPTFGQLAGACALNGITTEWCGVSSYDPNQIIPRNFGRGPSSLNVNLSLDKTFGFGKTGGSGSSQADGDAGGDHGRRGGRGGRGGRRGGFGGGRGGFGGSSGNERSPYNLSLGVRFNNILNINNQNNPVGNINSPQFGQSTNIQGGWGRGGARTIEFTSRFSW